MSCRIENFSEPQSWHWNPFSLFVSYRFAPASHRPHQMSSTSSRSSVLQFVLLWPIEPAMIIVSRAIVSSTYEIERKKNVDRLTIASLAVEKCVHRIPISAAMCNRVSQKNKNGYWKSRLFRGEMNALCNFNYRPKRHIKICTTELFQTCLLASHTIRIPIARRAFILLVRCVRNETLSDHISIFI